MSGETLGQRAVGWLLKKGGPRLLGAAVMAFGLALLGGNAAYIVNSGRYYGSLFILGLPMVAVGFWSVVTGITSAPQAKGPKPPLWWNVVSVGLAVVSVCYGLYLAIHLKKPGALDFWLGPAR